MAQILPRRQGIGELLGTGLGAGLSAGLSQGLSSLAQLKLQDIQRQQAVGRAATGLGALGYAPEQAQQIAQLDPTIQREIVKQQMRAPGEQAYAQALSQLLGTQAEPAQMPIQQPGIAEAQPEITPVQPRLTPEQATKLAQLGLQKEQIGEKRELAQRKETKAYRETILSQAKNAKESIMRLNRMDELNKTGKLDSPKFVSLLEKTGFNYPALLTPESQEFQKLSVDFLKNAKDIFGARVTSFEAEQFLKSIPSLTQTKEGKDRVIDNLKIMNEGANVRSKAMREIIKENRGIPPFDLQEQVEERVEPQIDKLAQEFVAGPKKQQVVAREEGLPSPAQYKQGDKLRNTETGQFEYIHTGTEWEKI